jgi:glycosyltransferase involved in cell wall biosynthesis
MSEIGMPEIGMPEIAICIPTRNRATLLKRAIEAALKQTYPRKAIYVMDNASTDATSDLVQTYQGMGVVHCPAPEDIGLYPNFIRCYRNVSEPFFVLCGDDDYFVSPSYITDAMSVLADAPLAVMAFGRVAHNRVRVSTFRATHRIVPGDVLIKGAQRHVPIPFIMGTVIRRDAALKTKLFDRGFPSCDVLGLMQIAAQGDVVLLDQPALLMENHNANDHLSKNEYEIITDLRTFADGLYNFLSSDRRLQDRAQSVTNWLVTSSFVGRVKEYRYSVGQAARVFVAASLSFATLARFAGWWSYHRLLRGPRHWSLKLHRC